MIYTRKAVRGVFKLFLFTFLANVLAYFLRILLARSLTTVEYGLIYSVFALFALLSVLQHMGLSEALIKYIAEFKAERRYSKIKSAIYFVLVFQFVTALILGLLGIIFADFLATHYFHNEAAVLVTRLFSISIILSPLELIFISIFFGFQRYFHLINFLRMVFIITITYLFLILGFSILAPVLAYILVYIIPVVFYYPLFIRKIMPSFHKIKAKCDSILYRKILYFGIPVILTSVAAMVISYTDTVIITLFRSLEEVALYNAAAPTARMLWIFSESLMLIVLPISSELWIKNRQYLKEGIELVYKYSFIIVFPMALILFTFPELILRLLFGEEFTGAALALRILAIGAVVLTVGNINNSVFSGIGKPKINGFITLTAALANIFLNLIFVPIYGIVGAAFSTLISFAIILVLSVIKLKSIVKVRVPWKKWFGTLIAGLVYLIILYVLKRLISANVLVEVIVSIILSGILYITLLFLLRVISLKELKVLIKRVI